MDNIEPLVSICIPAYNIGKFIQDTLKSVLEQSYRNLEVIIVNDGSTDDTASILSQINDPKVSIINTTNKGASAARNLAFTHSKGEYILFLDADDLIHTDFLSSQLKALNQVVDNVAISAWGRFYYNDLNTLSLISMPENISNLAEWVKYYWYHANPMTNPGRILIPRQIAELAGPWNEQLSLNDDLEYFTRIFAAASGIVMNPDARFYYRSGTNGLSSRKNEKAYYSLVHSLSLSIKEVLQRYPSDKKIRSSCANMWQSVLYEFYPHHKHFAQIAEIEIDKLGGSNLKFPAGGITRLLSNLIGWRSTKQLKKLFA